MGRKTTTVTSVMHHDGSHHDGIIIVLVTPQGGCVRPHHDGIPEANFLLRSCAET